MLGSGQGLGTTIGVLLGLGLKFSRRSKCRKSDR